MVDACNASVSLRCVLVSYRPLSCCVNACSVINMLFYLKKLAGEYGHTLFVGVDEYDAPANNSVFTGDTMGMPDARYQESQPDRAVLQGEFLCSAKGRMRRSWWPQCHH